VKVFDRWTSWPLAEEGLRGRVSREAVLVKLAGRLSNVQRLDRHPSPGKRRSYYRETVDWILALATGVPFFHEQYARWASRYAELG